MGRGELAEELSKTALATVTGKRGIDVEGWMEVMVEELTEFPADVTREALQRWRRREKYLPTVAEIVDECQWLGRRRAALRRSFG